jgi:hypothetical protein
VLAGFVSGFEPARFSGEDAGLLVATFSRIERLAAAGKTLAATRAAEANLHHRTGDRSPAEWLARQTGSSTGDAIGTLALGGALSTQPGVADAFKKGKLTTQRTKAVSDAVSVNPSKAGELVATAGSGTFSQLRQQCLRAKAEGRSAQSQADQAEALRRRRSCRTFTDDEGSVCLHAKLTPDDGARVVSVLRARADRVFAEARRQGVTESTEAYAADALVDLLAPRPGRGSADSTGSATGTSSGEDSDASTDSADSSDSADGTGTDSADGYGSDSADCSDAGTGLTPRGACTSTVHVRIDLEALRSGVVGPGQLCEIPGVGPIPVERAREIMGEALTRLVITDGIDVTTVCTLSRHIPAPVKVALLERDPTCVVPDCDRTDHLEIDHWQVDYAKNGPTAWWNLARLCSHHHRLKTTKGFRLQGGPGKWRFVAPTGTGGTSTTTTGDQRQPPDPPDPEPPEPNPPLFPHTE